MKEKLLIIVGLFLILTATLSFADGGFFPPVYYKEDIFEPSQKGIIFFDGNIEQLIIEAKYIGDITDFAWIIPVPSYPLINKTSPNIFEEIHFLTQPEYKTAPISTLSRGIIQSGIGMRKSSESYKDSSQVTLLEQIQVGVYEVSILSSEEPGALLKWLNDNNYRVSAEAESVLDYYIKKSWYFIAMRLNLAPSDEKLINSLKSINPTITSSEDAVTILSNDLTESILAKKEYNELTAIRTTQLDYGDDEQNEESRYSSQKPAVLINEYDYNKHYEAYNGYTEEHISREVRSLLYDNLRKQIDVPFSNNCYERGLYFNEGINYSRCSVWYFTRDSEEYKIVKNADCGNYCSLISDEKGQYTMDELAKVSANAILKDDEKLRSYFGVSNEEREWYYNQQDIFKEIERQVRNRLESTLNSKRESLISQLTTELLSKYSQTTGSFFGSIEESTSFFTDNILNDFKEDKTFISSYIYGYSLMNEEIYNRLKKHFNGNHDEVMLRKNVETDVKNVVYWKQNTIKRELNSGTIQPITLRFETANAIYPLKISSVNKGTSEVLLYVFAKHKTRVDGIEGFKVEYAKWIETKDIKTQDYYNYYDRVREYTSSGKVMPHYMWTPSTYHHLNQLLDDKYFLTKFRREMWPKEMTNDIILTKADNNKVYKLIVYEKGFVTGWILFIIYMVILWGFSFGILLLPRWINNILIKKRKKSVFYLTFRRCMVYASVVPLLVFLSVMFPNSIGRILGHIVEYPLDDIAELIFHLLNFTGLPKVASAILVFLLFATLLFLMLHIAGSMIVALYRRIVSKVK